MCLLGNLFVVYCDGNDHVLSSSYGQAPTRMTQFQVLVYHEGVVIVDGNHTANPHRKKPVFGFRYRRSLLLLPSTNTSTTMPSLSWLAFNILSVSPSEGSAFPRPRFTKKAFAFVESQPSNGRRSKSSAAAMKGMSIWSSGSAKQR